MVSSLVRSVRDVRDQNKPLNIFSPKQEDMESLEIDFKLKLKQADREYFLNGSSIIWGTIFYIRSARTGLFEGPYALDEDHLASMKEWLEAKMVWVKAE